MEYHTQQALQEQIHGIKLLISQLIVDEFLFVPSGENLIQNNNEFHNDFYDDDICWNDCSTENSENNNNGTSDVQHLENLEIGYDLLRQNTQDTIDRLINQDIQKNEEVTSNHCAPSLVNYNIDNCGHNNDPINAKNQSPDNEDFQDFLDSFPLEFSCLNSTEELNSTFYLPRLHKVIKKEKKR